MKYASLLILTLCLACAAAVKQTGLAVGTSSKITTEAHATFLDEGQQLQEAECRAQQLPTQEARTACMGLFSAAELEWWHTKFFPQADALRYTLFLALTTDATTPELKAAAADLVSFLAANKDKLSAAHARFMELKQ